jgi:16S rRNA (guanine966-N2)-methyltransferase
MLAPMNPRQPPRPGHVRIIGGSLRGRRIPVADSAALRPTPDRVRETLFNWLAPRLADAHVLDLYAGTGVLGLEALSRGAARLQAVERDRQLAAAIEAQALRMEVAARTGVVVSDVLGFLKRTAEPFDVVFLDPPYELGLWLPVLAQLAAGNWLAADAVVYVEYPALQPPPAWPQGFVTWKSSRAGQVGYVLLQREETSGGTVATAQDQGV